MANPPIHTVPADGGWENKREGHELSLDHHDTKAEAVEAGRNFARRDEVEHVIHTADGKIAERNSYGNDPAPPKG